MAAPTERRDRRDASLRRFLVVSITLGLGLQVPALFNPAFLGLGLFVMWAPTVAVLVAGPPARAVLRRMLERPFPWRTMVLAVLLGWFHKVAEGFIALASGSARWNGDHFALASAWRVSKADFLWFFPASGEVLPVFLVHFVVLQLFGAIFIAGPIGAFGEEAGWRGYLQPTLERRFGLFKGTLLVGVIWAYWHLGFMLAGYNDGGGHRVLNALVFFPTHVIVLAFLYAWLGRHSGSVWPAVCAHAANNSLPDEKILTVTSWWGDKAASLAATLLLGLLVLALLRRQRVPGPRYEAILATCSDRAQPPAGA